MATKKVAQQIKNAGDVLGKARSLLQGLTTGLRPPWHVQGQEIVSADGFRVIRTRGSSSCSLEFLAAAPTLIQDMAKALGQLIRLASMPPKVAKRKPKKEAPSDARDGSTSPAEGPDRGLQTDHGEGPSEQRRELEDPS